MDPGSGHLSVEPNPASAAAPVTISGPKNTTVLVQGLNSGGKPVAVRLGADGKGEFDVPANATGKFVVFTDDWPTPDHTSFTVAPAEGPNR